MSKKLVEQVLTNRTEFLKHLNTDLTNCEETIENTSRTVKEFEETLENVKFLGQKVEHTALIPLGKNIYVDGKIKHTGEYFLDKLAFPNSYSVVETLDKTVNFLENKIKLQADLLKKSEENKIQIEERIKLLKGDVSSTSDAEDLPREIPSDKGVAVKVGDFYEIVEFED